MGLYDVPVNELIDKTAEELRRLEQVTAPEWAAFAKTGSHKERPPIRDDWWHVRAAAMLRKIMVLGPIGTNKLRVHYGGRKNRGFKPERFMRGSGSITRKILQQLEKAELAKQETKGTRKGRVITPKGQSLLEKISSEIMKQHNLTLPKKPNLQKEKPVKKRKTARKKAEKPKSTKKKTAAKKAEETKVKEKKTEVKETPAETKPVVEENKTE